MRKNSPRVIMVMGKVKIVKKGLTVQFNIPSTSPVSIAVQILLTDIPENIQAIKYTINPLINMFRRTLIIKYFS